VAGAKELSTQHHMHARAITAKDCLHISLKCLIINTHAGYIALSSVTPFVWLQLAAEMHQLHAQQGVDMAGLPILVPNLTAQMLASKK